MSDYGYTTEGNDLIDKDAALLATITTAEEIVIAGAVEQVEAELWQRFIDAGGSDWHTGYSWGCVRVIAYHLLSKAAS